MFLGIKCEIEVHDSLIANSKVEQGITYLHYLKLSLLNIFTRY